MSWRSGGRNRVLRAFDADQGSELDRRWTRNTMLNKWLEYCIDLGHRFEPVDENSAGS
jgi:uncharacterized protein YqiB (DUF1249 family)